MRVYEKMYYLYSSKSNFCITLFSIAFNLSFAVYYVLIGDWVRTSIMISIAIMIVSFFLFPMRNMAHFKFGKKSWSLLLWYCADFKNINETHLEIIRELTKREDVAIAPAFYLKMYLDNNGVWYDFLEKKDKTFTIAFKNKDDLLMHKLIL